METLRSKGSLLGRLVAARCMAAGLATGASAQADASRHNVVVIMADDLDLASVDKLLALGLMPHLQQNFVDEGVRV
jgi:hypothetical protein